MRGVFALLRGGHGGSASALLKLVPASLGELKINLAMDQGRVSAMFGVSSEDAQASLSDSLPELRQALESRGLIVDDIKVDRLPKALGDQTAPDSAEDPADGRGLAGDSRSDTGGENPSEREARDGAALGAAEEQPGGDSPAGGTRQTQTATSRRLGVDLTA